MNNFQQLINQQNKLLATLVNTTGTPTTNFQPEKATNQRNPQTETTTNQTKHQETQQRQLPTDKRKKTKELRKQNAKIIKSTAPQGRDNPAPANYSNTLSDSEEEDLQGFTQDDDMQVENFKEHL